MPIGGEGIQSCSAKNMKEHKKTCENRANKMFAYTLPSFILAYVKEHPNDFISTGEILAKYFEITNKKLTKRAIQMAVKRLAKKGLLKTKRSEQLYVRFSPDTSLGVCDGKRTKNNMFASHSAEMFASRHKANKNKPSLCVKNPTQKNINLHALKVKIPIIKHGTLPNFVKTSDMYKEKKTKNWIKKYIKLQKPYPLTIEITPRSLIIHFKEQLFKQHPDFLRKSKELINITVNGITKLFARYNYVLDKEYKIINQHIATPLAEEIEKKIPSGTVVEITLNRKAKTHTGEIKQEARAWIDKSLGTAEQETNDIEYQKKLLLMPEIISYFPTFFNYMAQYNENTKLYTEQIKKHLTVLEEMSDTLKKIREELGRRR